MGKIGDTSFDIHHKKSIGTVRTIGHSVDHLRRFLLAGITSAVNTNLKPYIGMLLTNQNTVSSPPPATITDSSTNETGRMYFKLVV